METNTMQIVNKDNVDRQPAGHTGNVWDGELADSLLMPWENRETYQKLLADLQVEHLPRGGTENRLVEELAGILWRKRRLRLAEAAAYQEGVWRATSREAHTVDIALAHTDDRVQPGDVDFDEVLMATVEESDEALREISAELAITKRAIEYLEKYGFKRALESLDDEHQEGWENHILGKQIDPDDGPAWKKELECFLRRDTLPFMKGEYNRIRYRGAFRRQVLGAAFPIEVMGKLGAYEDHLDQRWQRILVMLADLQARRSGDSKPTAETASLFG